MKDTDDENVKEIVVPPFITLFVLVLVMIAFTAVVISVLTGDKQRIIFLFALTYMIQDIMKKLV